MFQATQFRRCRAGLIFYLGVAPDGVYTDPVCHHTSGELLPHLFILTYTLKRTSEIYISLNKSYRRLFSVALSLRFPSQDVILHHCSVEPGLSSYAAFRPCYTRLFNLLFCYFSLNFFSCQVYYIK